MSGSTSGRSLNASAVGLKQPLSSPETTGSAEATARPRSPQPQAHSPDLADSSREFLRRMALSSQCGRAGRHRFDARVRACERNATPSKGSGRSEGRVLRGAQSRARGPRWQLRAAVMQVLLDLQE